MHNLKKRNLKHIENQYIKKPTMLRAELKKYILKLKFLNYKCKKTTLRACFKPTMSLF